jgi:hypothetical protein
LTIPEQNQSAPKLVFKEPGTGVYTTYFFHPKGGDIYYLTLDKPGILPDFKNPEKPIVDRSKFDLYTVNTLVTCAQNALYWADDYIKNDKTKIILDGHSEGTMVMPGLLLKLYADKNKIPLQKKIKALFLTGLVTQPMSDVLEFQFKGEEYKQIMEAHKKHDADYLYNKYQINWHWLDDVLHQDRNKPISLVKLAEFPQGRTLPIEMFQGLYDPAVAAKAVEDLEKNNNAKPENKRLNLHARYYNTDHDLNETSFFDLSILHDYYLGEKYRPKP